RARKRNQIDPTIAHELFCELYFRGDEELEDAGKSVSLEHAIDETLDRDRAERCLRRWLPDAHIAADRREERVPRPHGDGKVERADDADEPERVPLLVHAMLRAFGVHRVSIQHARLADREIRDVDHLLNFPIAFGLDLAGLERHERAERVLVTAELIGDEPDELATFRRRNGAPLFERFARRGDHALVVLSGAGPHARERLSG